MKKLLALLLAGCMIFAFAACGDNNNGPTDAPTEAPTDPTDPPVVAMTYAEYMAADVEAECVVEFYVQDAQGWWFNNEVNSGVITIYGQSAEGGYFSYNTKCDEATAELLVPGTKIRVTGAKKIFDGEVEVMDGTLEILEADPWIAPKLDVTALMGTAELESHMNKKIEIKGATVADSGEGKAYLYKWNGSGSEGDDLYFNVTIGEGTYTLCVESYLCPLGSDAYEAVRGLQVGDVIDLEGFLYWYNGAQPHITAVVKK